MRIKLLLVTSLYLRSRVLSRAWLQGVPYGRDLPRYSHPPATAVSHPILTVPAHLLVATDEYLQSFKKTNESLTPGAAHATDEVDKQHDFQLTRYSADFDDKDDEAPMAMPFIGLKLNCCQKLAQILAILVVMPTIKLMLCAAPLAFFVGMLDACGWSWAIAPDEMNEGLLLFLPVHTAPVLRCFVDNLRVLTGFVHVVHDVTAVFGSVAQEARAAVWAL